MVLLKVMQMIPCSLGSDILLIFLYVDDIIITGSSQVPMQRLKIITYEELNMKELFYGS